ncbi:hypothetical protein FIU85_21930 (plasmid) [Roseovarius sp. THAF8]|uniref:hypothetical protein n=1 Tax=Roseovarius sp. THAF8 TaxID=2587846 RepID=UPI0012AA8104|nr:hypothetical protein [Roseovarius sp. THAF8]QFT99996.1 hypothetical protein FIU85_21930 [Roseovarius sp. THAF8]
MEVDCMPDGEEIDFANTVEAAGMRNVVTGNIGVRYTIIPGERDLFERGEGCRILGIGDDNLPTDPRDRACEVIRRLAYGFHDYAAREVAGRYHRDLKRELEAGQGQQPNVEMVNDRAKLLIHRIHARLIRQDASLIEGAKRRLAENPRYHPEDRAAWARVLDQDPDDVARQIVVRSEEWRRLRSMTPLMLPEPYKDIDTRRKFWRLAKKGFNDQK